MELLCSGILVTLSECDCGLLAPTTFWRRYFYKVKLVAIAFAIRVPKGSLLNAKKRFGTLLKSRVTPCEMDAWMKSRLEKDYGERKKRPSPLQEMQFLSDCQSEFCRRLSRETFFTFFFSCINLFGIHKRFQNSISFMRNACQKFQRNPLFGNRKTLICKSIRSCHGGVM